MFRKKVFRSMTAVVLSAGMAGALAGCGSKAPDTPAATTAAAVTEGAKQETAQETTEAAGAAEAAYADVQKPESISWCSHDGLDPVNGQEEWDAEYERLTGIQLEHTYVTGNEYNSKIELDYAADTVPDVFDLSSTYFPKYAASGALADLTDLIKESGLYDKADPSNWEQCSYDGKIYGVPKEIPQACGTYVRKDWLDRLGMEIPATYDEFITMLTGFRDEIDECLVPLTAPGLVSPQYLPDLYQGASCDFICVDGVWVDGMQQENMKKALENMRQCYAEGLLDMEAITNTTATSRDGWNAGTTGAFCYWTGNWGDRLKNELQKNVPEAEVVCIPPIEDTEYLYSTPTVHVINGRLSKEEAAQIFKYFIDYMHDGGEGQVLFEFGVEGVHWEQDGKNVKWLPSLSDESVTLNKCYVLPSSRLTALEMDDKSVTYSDAYVNSLKATENAGIREFQKPSETYSLIAAELKTQRDSIIAEIVTGNISVEDGLASYKAAADSLNVEQVLAEMNAQ